MKRFALISVLAVVGVGAFAQNAYQTLRESRIASFASDLSARDYRHILLYVDAELLANNVPDDDPDFDLSTPAGINNALLNWVFMFEDQSQAFRSMEEITSVIGFEDTGDAVLFTVKLASGRSVEFLVYLDDMKLLFFGASG